MKSTVYFASFLRFTFLVWVKSVLSLLFCIGISFMLLFSNPNKFPDLDDLWQVFLIPIIALLYTTPLFIVMLIVVYLINRTKLEIIHQKIVIYFVLVIPFICFLFFNFEANWYQSKEIVLPVVAFFLAVPAIMISITELLPSTTQLTTNKTRSDLIDDIDFDD